MESLRHLLPSAGNLIIFEAAGRLASFTAAARELGVTQAAVSYAIRGLERQLGVTLFTRGHRQVRLTDAGQRFFADVTLGLSHIRKSAEELRAFARGEHVTLSTSTAFASFWMLPRLQQFRDELPDIDLRIQTSDRDIDLITEGIPLGVRGGAADDFPFYDSLPLALEEIYAVAGASYAARPDFPQSVADVMNHRLIHLEEPFRDAATWTDWFRSASMDSAPVTRGLLINDYVPVIQAVMDGQGIALGWRHLTDRMVANGVLVQVGDHVMKTGKAFHIVWPKGRELSTAARHVRDWLAAQAG